MATAKRVSREDILCALISAVRVELIREGIRGDDEGFHLKRALFYHCFSTESFSKSLEGKVFAITYTFFSWIVIDFKMSSFGSCEYQNVWIIISLI